MAERRPAVVAEFPRYSTATTGTLGDRVRQNNTSWVLLVKGHLKRSAAISMVTRGTQTQAANNAPLHHRFVSGWMRNVSDSRTLTATGTPSFRPGLYTLTRTASLAMSTSAGCGDSITVMDAGSAWPVASITNSKTTTASEPISRSESGICSGGLARSLGGSSTAAESVTTKVGGDGVLFRSLVTAGRCR